MLEEVLHTWESTKDGRIQVVVYGEKITIDQVLIVKQFGVNVEGMVDASNMLIKEAQVALKNIAKPDAFTNKERWSVIRMKEEFHARFAYFNNRISIILNLANKGKKISWCSITLTQMSIELTWWTEHQKQITTWLITLDRKATTYYSGPVIEVYIRY